jgi:FKBP-type peptidyl-prolyl cis-trans isomerase
MNIISWKKSQIIILAVVLGSLVLNSCDSFSDYPGFKEAKSGLLYKFYTKGDGRKAEIGDYLKVELRYKTTEDSLLFDGSGKTIPLELVEPVFAGDINEALAMMSKGDSATFIIRADSFLIRNAHLNRLPDFIDKKSRIIFDIKMLDVQSVKELEQANEKARREGLKKEEEDINDYILKNNIAVNPDENGLYFITLRKGKGNLAKRGQHVFVHYVGKFLNGKVFDSSYSRGKPIEFELGRGYVIKGWEDGISKMRKGGKAIFLIPSELGYGAGRGQIPPYTPLLFEVELIDVK